MQKNLSIKEVIVTTGIFLASMTISCFFYIWGFSEANIIMVFILGVVITALNTSGYAYCISFSVISVLAFNYFFTEPRFGFSADSSQYPVTFIIMFIIAILAGTSTVKFKRQMAISEKNAMLAEKERIRSNILRSVSHDLRTPLTSISGCVNSLIENKNLDTESRTQMLTDIKNDTNWLIRLIENLLSISKIEEGQLQVDKEMEAIEEIIAEALDRALPLMEQRTIETRIPDDILLVPINGGLIIQVLINLIENAVKHSPNGSTITITVIKNEKTAVITVSDQGSGIDESDLPHIFEIFYTTEKSGDSRRGAGLGLSICKAIVEAHGGGIDARNNKVGGTNIRFTLPLRKE